MGKLKVSDIAYGKNNEGPSLAESLENNGFTHLRYHFNNGIATVIALKDGKWVAPRVKDVWTKEQTIKAFDLNPEDKLQFKYTEKPEANKAFIEGSLDSDNVLNLQHPSGRIYYFEPSVENISEQKSTKVTSVDSAKSAVDSLKNKTGNDLDQAIKNHFTEINELSEKQKKQAIRNSYISELEKQGYIYDTADGTWTAVDSNERSRAFNEMFDRGFDDEGKRIPSLSTLFTPVRRAISTLSYPGNPADFFRDLFSGTLEEIGHKIGFTNTERLQEKLGLSKDGNNNLDFTGFDVNGKVYEQLINFSDSRSEHSKKTLQGIHDVLSAIFADPTQRQAIGTFMTYFMGRDEKGRFGIIPQVRTALLLSAVAFIPKVQAYGHNLTRDEIPNALEENKYDVLLDDEETLDLGGLPKKVAIQHFATTIRKVMGIAPKNGALNETANAALFQAAQIMASALEKAGFLESDTGTYQVYNHKTGAYDTRTVPVTKVTEKYRAFVRAKSNIVEELLEQKFKNTVHFEPPAINDRIGGTTSPTTLEQTRYLKTRNNLAHTLNSRLWDNLSKLNVNLDNLVDWYVEFQYGKNAEDPTISTKDFRQALKGKRTTYMLGVELLKSMGNKKVYFDHEFVRNGRLNQIGAATPQSNPLLRVLCIPEAADLDLTNAQQLTLWKVALAQKLGYKVSDVAYNTYGNDIDRLLEKLKNLNEITPDAIKDLITKRSAPSQRLPQSLKDRLEDSEGNLEAYSALVEAFDYVHTTDSKQLKKFKSTVRLEIDAKTSGSALLNRMAAMSSGVISERILTNLWRTGFLVGLDADLITALDTNQELLSKEEQDQYREVAESALPRNIITIYDSIKNVKSKGTQESLRTFYRSLLTLFKALGYLDVGHADIDTFLDDSKNIEERVNALHFTRSSVKKVCQIIPYGSKAKGTTQAFLAQIQKDLNKKFSEYLRKLAEAEQNTKGKKLSEDEINAALSGVEDVIQKQKPVDVQVFKGVTYPELRSVLSNLVSLPYDSKNDTWGKVPADSEALINGLPEIIKSPNDTQIKLVSETNFKDDAKSKKFKAQYKNGVVAIDYNGKEDTFDFNLLQNFEITPQGLNNLISASTRLLGPAIQISVSDVLGVTNLSGNKFFTAGSEILNMLNQMVFKTQINNQKNGATSPQKMTEGELNSLYQYADEFGPTFTYERGNRAVIGRYRAVSAPITDGQRRAFGTWASNPTVMVPESSGASGGPLNIHVQDGTINMIGGEALSAANIFHNSVHDGEYISPSQAMEAHDILNRAVQETTQQNIFKIIHERIKEVGEKLHADFGLGTDWQSAIEKALVLQSQEKDLKGKKLSSPELKEMAVNDLKNLKRYAKDALVEQQDFLDVALNPSHNLDKRNLAYDEDNIKLTAQRLIKALEQKALVQDVVNRVLKRIPTTYAHMSVVQNGVHKQHEKALTKLTPENIRKALNDFNTAFGTRLSLKKLTTLYLNTLIYNEAQHTKKDKEAYDAQLQALSELEKPKILSTEQLTWLENVLPYAIRNSREGSLEDKILRDQASEINNEPEETQTLDPEAITSVFRDLSKKMPYGLKGIYSATLGRIKNLIPNGVTVRFVKSFRNLPREENKYPNPATRGVYDPKTNTVWIVDDGTHDIFNTEFANSPGSILVHELAHGALDDIFLSFISGDTSKPGFIRGNNGWADEEKRKDLHGALRRHQYLVNDFLTLNLNEYPDLGQLKRFQDALKALRAETQLAQTRKDNATYQMKMAEFLEESFVYFNTNYELLEQLGKVKFPEQTLRERAHNLFEGLLHAIKKFWEVFFGKKNMDELLKNEGAMNEFLKEKEDRTNFIRLFGINSYILSASIPTPADPVNPKKHKGIRHALDFSEESLSSIDRNRGGTPGTTASRAVKSARRFFMEAAVRSKDFLSNHKTEAKLKQLSKKEAIAELAREKEYGIALGRALTPFIPADKLALAVQKTMALMDKDFFNPSQISKMVSFRNQVLNKLSPYAFALDKNIPSERDKSVRIYDFLVNSSPITKVQINGEFPTMLNKAFETTALMYILGEFNPDIKKVLNSVKDSSHTLKSEDKNIFTKAEDYLYEILSEKDVSDKSFSDTVDEMYQERINFFNNGMRDTFQTIEDSAFAKSDQALFWAASHFPFKLAFKLLSLPVKAVAALTGKSLGSTSSNSSQSTTALPVPKVPMGELNRLAPIMWLDGVANQFERFASGTPYVMLMGRLKDIYVKSGYTLKIQERFKALKGFWDKNRQHLLENLPKHLIGKFNTEITNRHKALLHKAFLWTNISTLSLNDVPDFFKDPARVNQEIAKIEALLPADRLSYYRQKIDETAKYGMRVANAAPNLLLSAQYIAEGRGDKGYTVNSVLIHNIDMLLSLRSIQLMGQAERKEIANLFRTDKEGMETLYKEVLNTRSIEEQGNYYKHAAYNGYYRGLNRNSDMCYVPHSKLKMYTSLGYKVLTKYAPSKGDSSEPYYLMYTENAHNRNFLEGLLQTINQTSKHYDIDKRSREDIVGASISDPVALSRMLGKNVYSSDPNFANPIPIYNDAGTQVVAYDRSIPVQFAGYAEEQLDIFTALGQQQARRERETKAREFNTDAINLAVEYWNEATPEEREKYFVDIFSSDDPTIKEAIRRLDPRLKAKMKKAFNGHFYVRKSELFTFTGYRRKSLVDTADNMFPLPDDFNICINKLMHTIFGEQAMHRVLTIEAMTSSAAAYARNTIVVRSLVVPMANLVGNIIQLHASLGIPFREILRIGMETYKHTETYNRLHNKIFELTREQIEHPEGRDAIQIKIDRLTQEIEALPIYDLIKKGVYSTISDKGKIVEEVNFVKQRLGDNIAGVANMLPEGMNDFVSNVLMTQNSAAYKSALKAVNYSDWFAKVIAYRFLTEASQYNHTQYDKTTALALADLLFVDYDQFTTPGMDYLNNMGMVWFMMYKYRIFAGAMVSLMMNPSRALLGGALATTIGTGTVITDSALVKMFQGTLGYSLGPASIIRGIMMHPLAVLLGLLI